MAGTETTEATPRVWFIPVATPEQIAGGWSTILDLDESTFV